MCMLKDGNHNELLRLTVLDARNTAEIIIKGK